MTTIKIEDNSLNAAIDALCKEAGYERWWVARGRLFFEKQSDIPGMIKVLLVTVQKS